MDDAEKSHWLCSQFWSRNFPALNILVFFILSLGCMESLRGCMVFLQVLCFFSHPPRKPCRSMNWRGYITSWRECVYESVCSVMVYSWLIPSVPQSHMKCILKMKKRANRSMSMSVNYSAVWCAKTDPIIYRASFNWGARLNCLLRCHQFCSALLESKTYFLWRNNSSLIFTMFVFFFLSSPFLFFQSATPTGASLLRLLVQSPVWRVFRFLEL